MQLTKGPEGSMELISEIVKKFDVSRKVAREIKELHQILPDLERQDRMLTRELKSYASSEQPNQKTGNSAYR